MKRLIINLIVIFFTIPATFANEPKRGYRGFVEWDNSIGRMDVTKGDCASGNCETKRDADWLTGIATTHGFQFNPHCFLGAGLMLSLSANLNVMWPIYTDFRYDVKFGKFSPYFDFKLGYIWPEVCYISPTIGYRCDCGGKANINFGLGLTLLHQQWESVSYIPYPPYNQNTTEHETLSLITLRIGVDF